MLGYGWSRNHSSDHLTMLAYLICNVLNHSRLSWIVVQACVEYFGRKDEGVNSAGTFVKKDETHDSSLDHPAVSKYCNPRACAYCNIGTICCWRSGYAKLFSLRTSPGSLARYDVRTSEGGYKRLSF
jgi:hypothetical protein